MPGSVGPNLGLTWGWAAGEDGWGLAGYNPAMALLDAVVNLSVLSATVAVPPSAPAAGDRYIVGPAASGTWAAKDGQVAVYRGGAWAFYPPVRGWRAEVQDSGKFVYYGASDWVDEPVPGGGAGAVAVEDEGTEITAAAVRLNFSGAGVTVTDAGSGEVTIDIPGGGAGSGSGGVSPYGGARISPTATQNYTTIGAVAVVRFLQAERDTGGFWSNTQPNRLTVPPGSGITKVRLRASLQVDSADTIGANVFNFYRNGVLISEGNASGAAPASTSGAYNNSGVGIASDVLDVAEGDYFEVRYFAAESFSLYGAPGGRGSTWFAIEAVERTLSNVGLNARVRDLLDVAAPTPADKQSLIYSATAGKWVPGTPIVAIESTSGMYKPFRGAMARFNASKSYTAPTFPILWDAVDYDTNALWSAASPGRFTVPAGVQKIRLTACLVPVALPAGSSALLQFGKNGSTSFRGCALMGTPVGNTGVFISITSPVIPAAGGDFFELRWNCSVATAVSFTDLSYFAIEVIEAAETLP